ncbi:MAG: OmpH family outer membrane protein [Candidatus Omnitrophica bacterium]|nr:OmpH family outer membrane protein [Candidatus Omnitrophota bacterium]MCA9416096.1 OmpH family outer membrane protein [Candidatus Omnitrophota bacterium]MCA9424201.1 OmpH family outer membrane protein [Candidatus Omnitrophota bacterium]MCA9429271.1 OmpH family outer membrane protein [Candidatus Omnitrophota bacterium]MCA9435159.1 OmpH family outer membrane protein [Candidatus Omnitrophota bacterium]
MRNEWLIVIAFILGIVFTSTFDNSATAQRQELLAVRFVDLVRVRDEFKDYQTALSQIKTNKEKEQGELDDMVSMFDKNVKNYELKEGLITEEEQKLELEQLNQKYQTLQETHQQMSRELEMKSREILKPLLDQMKTAIEQEATSKGYHLIFWKKDLAYSDSRLDITDDVLLILNK